VKVRLEYGREGLEVELPNWSAIQSLGLQEVSPLADLLAAVREAVQNPIGSPPLAELAVGKRTACLVICDVTRPVPNAPLLAVVLDTLRGAGMSDAQIKILIATGTHRPNLRAELVELVGASVLDAVEVINHDSRADHPLLGLSPNGIPVRLNSLYVEAELRITIGMIEPHFMAGYAGGRKMVMPGVAALETIQAWHSPRFLEHPLATNGELEGNPVHEEALAIAKMARAHFIVDVALDSNRQVYDVFAGDVEVAWLAGVSRVERVVRAEIAEPVDVVLTSGGGFPLDQTFYQAIKGMVGALPILRPGGHVVIVAACDEGIGHSHFADLLHTFHSLEGFVSTIQRPDWRAVPDQWQVEELAKVVRLAKVWMVCRGIGADDLSRLFVEPVASVEAALAGIKKELGRMPTMAVIPKGPYVLPCVSRA
jgi:nickel-dependent lactate racemase